MMTYQQSSCGDDIELEFSLILLQPYLGQFLLRLDIVESTDCAILATLDAAFYPLHTAKSVDIPRNL